MAENKNTNQGDPNNPNRRDVHRANMPPPPHPHWGPPPPGFMPPSGYTPYPYPPSMHPMMDDEYEEIEYIEEIVEEEVDADSNGQTEEIVEEIMEDDGALPEGQNIASETFKTFEEDSSIGQEINLEDEHIKKVLREGNTLAAENQLREERKNNVFFVLKLFWVLLAVVVLGVLSYVAYDILSASESDANISASALDESAWTLPDEKGNNIVRDFFKSISTIFYSSKIRNKLLHGNLELRGESFSFYCIEKNRQLYMNTNRKGAKDDKFYLLEMSGQGKSLRTGSIIGPSTALPQEDSEALLNLMYFDEALLIASYTNSEYTKYQMKYVGNIAFKGALYEAVDVRIDERYTERYFFDPTSGLLIYRFVERNGHKIYVEYSDYAEITKDYKYPIERSVYIDDLKLASCKINAVTVNKDAMFPR